MIDYPLLLSKKQQLHAYITYRSALEDIELQVPDRNYDQR